MYAFFRFGEPLVLWYVLPALGVACIVRYFMYKQPTYMYTLAYYIDAQRPGKQRIFTLSALLRLVTLLLIALLCARPQLGDVRQLITVNGIDMVVVLDVSGSMGTCDFEDDPRPRIDIAKAEAIRFVEKRVNDAIGLVIFGNDILSRCPLTMDKGMLKKIIDELCIGIIDHRGTVLAHAVVAGANRLKKAGGKSKVMILLTDGEPSDNDIPVETALEIVRALGIKVYTVGIGNDEPQLQRRSMFMIPYNGVNKQLLTKIATSTGGCYFCARNAADMRRIYDEIDLLETTDHEMPVFTQWYDVYLPLVICILLMMLFSLMISTVVWCML
jgi:Ca-activated chloride channel family protein